MIREPVRVTNFRRQRLINQEKDSSVRRVQADEINPEKKIIKPIVVKRHKNCQSVQTREIMFHLFVLFCNLITKNHNE